MANKKLLSLASTILILTPLATLLAATSGTPHRIMHKAMVSVPQPTACIVPEFTKNGNQYWWNINLKLTNKCTTGVDFQNATITFNNSQSLNTNFWGNFGSLTYPDNNLQITSQPVTGGYLATMNLHFPEQSWAKTILPVGESITLQYGSATAGYDANSVKVYVGGTQPVETGEIDLTNLSSQPSGVTQTYAFVDLAMGGQIINRIQLPWSATVPVTGLAPGNYNIQPEGVSDSQGNVFQGNANPSSVTVNVNQKVQSNITYASVANYGSINIQVSSLPTQLSGYTGVPVVELIRQATGAITSKQTPWNTTTTVSNLVNNAVYGFSTPIINYNGVRCNPTFTPSLVTSAQTPAKTTLTYACSQVVQASVNINISGLPTTTSTLNVTFTPSDGTTPVTKAVPITNGAGTTTVNLTDGVIYGVSAGSVAGYNASFNPQPLTARNGANETIVFAAQPVSASGRVMTYIPGWKTPPTAASLKDAGYTNVLIAFGLFSTGSGTIKAGEIVPGFDTVSKDYINQLKQAGIKVTLSLGGALTSLPNTTVDFHEVVAKYSNPTDFKNVFVASIKKIVADYGFDGIDIDVEHGINAGGTFANPTGDIRVLADSLNQLHADLPNLLISLTPQTANISATSGFDGTWANYASLIMQTARSLSWVGIQLYNTGCMYGIDKVCYDPNRTGSPDFSVAMATDLLENWPAKLPNGQASGFQPYVSSLTPSQVVLGYPAPNASGASDGAPATPTATIKRAIQCLQTRTNCDTFTPPRAYPGMGGVFNWEVTYDQANGFKWAKDLAPCVLRGVCS